MPNHGLSGYKVKCRCGVCVKAHREYNRKWRKQNPEKVNKATRGYHAKRRELINSFKSESCMDCGGSFPPECMDFDHREGESKLITIGSRIKTSIENILKEIEKCDLICANCHRTRTKNRGYKNHTNHNGVQLP